MMLNLFKHLEEDMAQRRNVLPRIGMLTTTAPESAEAANLRASGRVKQTFRLVVQASVTTEDTERGRSEAKEKAARLLAHHLFSDVRDELADLLRHCYRTGAGHDVEKRVERLLALVDGHDAPDIPES